MLVASAVLSIALAIGLAGQIYLILQESNRAEKAATHLQRRARLYENDNGGQ